MPEHVVIFKIQPVSTASHGRTDLAGDVYDPGLAETNSEIVDDPFFWISPAIAAGDAYISEEAESDGG